MYLSSGATLADGSSQTGVIVAITVAAIGAIATFTVGLLNYLTQRRGLRQEENQQRQQLQLMVSSQVTDGFTKAIDHLGSANKAVRIGGIFALERIARDSPVDCANIAATLATFIREAQPVDQVGPPAYVRMLKVRAPDVQVALTVLARPPLSASRTGPGRGARLDLSRTDLRRASLSGAHLEGVNLWLCRLDGSDLVNAHLQGAILSGASLGRFDPENTLYEQGADLSGADLTGAEMNNVKGLDEVRTSGSTRGLIR